MVSKIFVYVNKFYVLIFHIDVLVWVTRSVVFDAVNLFVKVGCFA